MRPLIALCLVLWHLTAPGAQAGAWLREKGSGFTSLSFGFNQFEEGAQSLYFEYGLTEKMTVGLDVTTATLGSDFHRAAGHLFFRRKLWDLGSPHQLSYEIGVGGIYQDDLILPTLKAGISWGRGFQFRDRSGWVNVTAAFIYEPMMGENVSKLDATLGLELGKITTGMIELNLQRKDRDLYQAVEPSLLIRPRTSKFNFKVGAKVPIADPDKSSLKLGIWHSF